MRAQIVGRLEFPEYEQEAWVAVQRYRDRPWAELVDLWVALNRHVAAIIETGFLNLDREFLTKHTDLVAEGVVEGILCFANNENVDPTAVPNLTP